MPPKRASSLEKQLRKVGALSSWYTGTEQQFRAARLLRIPDGFAFPARIGGRKLYSLPVFCPAAARAELKCTIARTGEDRYRLAILNETMPVAWRSLGAKIDVYKYCDLREGANTGPATVYVGPLAALQTAGIAPPEAEHPLQKDGAEQRVCLWQSQALDCGRHRFVVHHEAEARASAQDEERGRSNFKNPEQYQDWLLEVVAASIGMIRRQLRVKTKRRFIYTVPTRDAERARSAFREAAQNDRANRNYRRKRRRSGRRAASRAAPRSTCCDARRGIPAVPGQGDRHPGNQQALIPLHGRQSPAEAWGLLPFIAQESASRAFTPMKGAQWKHDIDRDSATHRPLNGSAHDEALPATEASESILRAALTKEELQNLLFENIGLTKRECRDMVNVIFEEMRAALEAGETVKLEGFGRFQPKEQAETLGPQPEKRRADRGVRAAGGHLPSFPQIDR